MQSILLRKILGGLSLTSALFMFQACYGTGPDYKPDILIEGRVTSARTGDPIKGIKISNADGYQYQFSDPDGKFSFYTDPYSNKKFHFEDVDSTENGSFLSRDTVPEFISNYAYLEISLEEK
jgi:hypothetical protein